MSAGLDGRCMAVPVDSALKGAQLWVPDLVATSTERLLTSYGGGDDHEGIVFWGGLETPQGSVALIAFAPSAVTTYGSFRTDCRANVELMSGLAEHGLTLVAQVHSHPGDWVDHSDGDDTGALVRFDGFWSVVVPEYAHSGMQPLHRCGVHLFGGGRFLRLSTAAVMARVHVLPPEVDLR